MLIKWVFVQIKDLIRKCDLLLIDASPYYNLLCFLHSYITAWKVSKGKQPLSFESHALPRALRAGHVSTHLSGTHSHVGTGLQRTPPSAQLFK